MLSLSISLTPETTPMVSLAHLGDHQVTRRFSHSPHRTQFSFKENCFKPRINPCSQLKIREKHS